MRSDPDNVSRDSQIPDDPDYPSQPDRDVYLVNATYDDEYLYLAWRRTAGGQKAITFGGYIDTSGDGLLQDGEPVVVYTVGNGSPYCDQGWILDYHQARQGVSGPLLYPEGDPMGMDGDTPDGWARWQDGFKAPTHSLDAYLAPDGIECEARVAWADLGLEPGSPISIHFASGNGESWGTAGTPSNTWKSIGGGRYIEENRGQVEDNIDDLWWLRRSGVSVTPDNVAGAAAGTYVTYLHTISNLGNSAETYDLDALSSSGWLTVILDSEGNPITSLDLEPEATATVEVRVLVPIGTLDGTVDVTALRATARSDTSIVGSAIDVTSCGRVTITPDRQGTVAAGQRISYTFTVRNSLDTTGTFDVDYSSTAGFAVEIADESGVPTSSILLGPGEFTEVTAHVSVPAGTSNGTQDVTRVFATLASDPAIFATATATTTVRDGIEIVPDRAGVAGAATVISYRHTVTNSWPTERTVSLSASSDNGWPVALFASDGVTPITEIVLGPNGASGDVIVRVSVPSGIADGVIDVTTVTATAGTTSDAVTDTTTVRRLALYETPGYADESASYLRGDTVYARATGLTPGADVYFVWRQPSGAVMRTSSTYKIDTQGASFDEYRVSDEAPLGWWTCELHDARNGALLESTLFNVGLNAEITQLSATDAATIGAATTVTSTLSNPGATAITGSSANYRIWWDSDADGSFGTGDIYIDSAGDPQVHSGGYAPWTHTTAGVDVASGGTWTDPGWTASSASFPNQGTYRVTEVWLDADGTTVIDTALTQFFSVPTVGDWFANLGVPSLPVIAFFGILWATGVAWLRSKRAWLLFYVTGTLGFVVLVLFVAQALGLDTRFESAEASQVAWLAELFGLRLSLLPPSGLAIDNHVGWGVFDIGIECSALLEMSAFAALAGFYPAWRASRKARFIALGVALTYAVNLLRILIIVAMIAWLGTGWVFVAHAVVGRIFFFAGIVVIFWFLMTRPTIRTVGERLGASHG